MYILIGFVITLVILSPLMIMARKKHQRLNQILKQYPKQATVLLNRPAVSDIFKLTAEEKRVLLNTRQEDWETWQQLHDKLLPVADRYPDVFNEFVFENISSIKERPYFSKQYDIFKSPITISKQIVDALTLDELQQLCAETDESWKKRKEDKTAAEKIRKEYTEGFKRFEKNCGQEKLTNRLIVRNKNRIAEYQKQFDKASAFNNWETSQNDFGTKAWQLIKDNRPQDGRYFYMVPYKRPAEDGTLLESEFKIWQGFCSSFSPFRTDIQDEQHLTKLNNIEEFKCKERYFTKDAYNSIFAMVEAFSEDVESKPLIIIGENGFDRDVIDYQFSHLITLLNNHEYQVCRFRDLMNLKCEIEPKFVIIFDFITTNDELKYTSAIVVEHFTSTIPNVLYYSMLKQYDEDEIVEIFNARKEKELKEKEAREKADKKFIKEQFLRVNKNPFFSYYAITNTLIGEAGNSDKIKKVWLSDDKKFSVVKRDKDVANHITCKFSTDYEANYADFSRPGEYSNIDDVVNFTYDLFLAMGLLQQFKQYGAKAIDKMNALYCLAYH